MRAAFLASGAASMEATISPAQLVECLERLNSRVTLEWAQAMVIMSTTARDRINMKP